VWVVRGGWGVNGVLPPLPVDPAHCHPLHHTHQLQHHKGNSTTIKCQQAKTTRVFLLGSSSQHIPPSCGHHTRTRAPCVPHLRMCTVQAAAAPKERSTKNKNVTSAYKQKLVW
jgi:hypothetical protein